MGYKNSIFLLFLCLPFFGAHWVEDSQSVAFEYPRGWTKSVKRAQNFMIVDFIRPEKARITVDSYRRNDSIDLDRYVEYRIDLYLKNHADLKILAEKKFGPARGFDDMVFIVINYTENNKLISNRILFSKKADVYYAVQCITFKEIFGSFKKDFDIITRSFQYRDYIPGRWRNDSLFYLDPEKDHDIIHSISEAAPKNPANNQEKRPVRQDPVMQEPVAKDSDSYKNQ